MALGAAAGTLVGLAAKTAGCCAAFVLGRALLAQQAVHVSDAEHLPTQIAAAPLVAPAAGASGRAARLLRALRRVVTRSPWRGALLVLSSPLPASIKVYGLAAMPAVSLRTFAAAAAITGAPYTLLLALLGSTMGDTAAQHGSAGEVNPTAAAVRLSLTVLAAAGTAAAAAVAAAALRHELASDAVASDDSDRPQSAPLPGAEAEQPPCSTA